MRYLLIFFFFAYGCTDEPDLYNYEVSVLNNSTENLTIETYLEGVIDSNVNIENGVSGLKCSYSDDKFRGFKFTECLMDSIVFRFDNGKGYISSINYPSIYNFPNDENPFGVSSKYSKTKNVYEFVITQEDFENAYDLPQ